ncbi:enoyl-CoA hydratase/isomerase family protein [Raineyella sp. LH-20]|uniref:enoyl-CoA hydratase/isomerase family protein n=1 Tax=Raineyella sp. LH-20 TaxID=3081204 RepID=UPI002953B230|nr:enoyl-CoA hydratase/isomerase family protein [Raineyella sp. LH-20]WOP19925.1 enoyl-CoA hydratase/isomerase family protein [Raineyella sp. LH-20]
MSETGRLTLETRGATALITIDHPRKRNAMTTPMWSAWPALMERVVADDDVRVVVITGASGHFCAGADISELDTILDNDRPTNAHEAIARCPKPTIAAINGSCVGGGVLMAGACDIRIAGLSARFGVPPANLGLVYPPIPLERLVRLIGPAATKYLIFTAGLIGGERARHIGFVDELLPDDVVLHRALALADDIAKRSQLSIQATKDLVDRMVDRTLTAQRVDAWMEQVANSPDLADGTAAFLERRPARFSWNGAGLPD